MEPAAVQSTPSTPFLTHADGLGTCQEREGTAKDVLSAHSLSPTVRPEPAYAQVVHSNTARGNETTRRRRRPRKTPQCWNCGILGHTNRSCPQLQVHIQKLNNLKVSDMDTMPVTQARNPYHLIYV